MVAENSADASVVINAVEKALYYMAYFDIERALDGHPPANSLRRNTVLTNGRHAMGAAFILSACLIEAAGHYVTGIDGSEASFTAFVTKYMPSYNPTILYKVLRCRMVHNYTSTRNVGGVTRSYLLTHNQRFAHLQQDTGNADVVYLNVQDFVIDVKDALREFFKGVRINASHEQVPFLQWAETLGFFDALPTTATAALPGTPAIASVTPQAPAATPPVVGAPAAARQPAAASPPTTSILVDCATGMVGLGDLGVSSVTLHAATAPARSGYVVPRPGVPVRIFGRRRR